MCEKVPGPRCASHLSKEMSALSNQLRLVRESGEDATELEERFEKVRVQYYGTPTGRDSLDKMMVQAAQKGDKKGMYQLRALLRDSTRERAFAAQAGKLARMSPEARLEKLQNYALSQDMLEAYSRNPHLTDQEAQAFMYQTNLSAASLEQALSYAQHDSQRLQSLLNHPALTPQSLVRTLQSAKNSETVKACLSHEKMHPYVLNQYAESLASQHFSADRDSSLYSESGEALGRIMENPNVHHETAMRLVKADQTGNLTHAGLRNPHPDVRDSVVGAVVQNGSDRAKSSLLSHPDYSNETYQKAVLTNSTLSEHKETMLRLKESPAFKQMSYDICNETGRAEQKYLVLNSSVIEEHPESQKVLYASSQSQPAILRSLASVATDGEVLSALASHKNPEIAYRACANVIDRQHAWNDAHPGADAKTNPWSRYSAPVIKQFMEGTRNREELQKASQLVIADRSNRTKANPLAWREFRVPDDLFDVEGESPMLSLHKEGTVPAGQVTVETSSKRQSRKSKKKTRETITSARMQNV